MDEVLQVAAQRMLTLQDVSLTDAAAPDSVREKCDLIAKEVASRYLSGSLAWSQADQIANHLYDLMIQRCGPRVPDYAWEVFLAFDEAEAAGQSDSFTRPRLTEVMGKYDAA